VAGGLLVGAFALAQAWCGYFNRWRHLAVENFFVYWTFTAVHWLLIGTVLYVTPYVA
jgi:heme/copper-type cytochrome/quinol oxidase subunit 3